jgi:hypothetical protein
MSYFLEPGEAVSRQLGLVGLVICAVGYLWVVSLALRGKNTGVPDVFHWILLTMMVGAGGLASWGNMMDSDGAILGGILLGTATILVIVIWAKLLRR